MTTNLNVKLLTAKMTDNNMTANLAVKLLTAGRQIII